MKAWIIKTFESSGEPRIVQLGVCSNQADADHAVKSLAHVKGVPGKRPVWAEEVAVLHWSQK